MDLTLNNTILSNHIFGKWKFYLQSFRWFLRKGRISFCHWYDLSSQSALKGLENGESKMDPEQIMNPSLTPRPTRCVKSGTADAALPVLSPRRHCLGLQWRYQCFNGIHKWVLNWIITNNWKWKFTTLTVRSALEILKSAQAVIQSSVPLSLYQIWHSTMGDDLWKIKSSTFLLH